ncbi:unnamed protein product [Rhizophagus irregularis]|nr:unnamed protein product [Rhizophagus irregularis]
MKPKSNYKIPQAILNIIKKCWDADPLKRLKAQELYKLVVYTSGLLDFKNLPEPKNVIDNNDNNNLFEEYSKSCEIDITTLNLDKTE